MSGGDVMLIEKPYNRIFARQYAVTWAFTRNPLFYDFQDSGGDCTSFVSQSIYAGSCVMNYTPNSGWYYRSLYDRAPAWSGVQFLYDFLISNEGEGPFGSETNAGGLRVGDIIQLGNSAGEYYHTLIVTDTDRNGYLVSAHTYDALNRPLYTYDYENIRFIRIDGVRENYQPLYPCFDGLISGTSL